MARSKLKQANFLLPQELVDEMHELVSRGEQSKFAARALDAELKRLKFEKAINSCFGAWCKEKHPELERGVERFIRKQRRSSRNMRG